MTPPDAENVAEMAAEIAAESVPTQQDWSAEGQRAERVSMNALTRRGLSRWELGDVLRGRGLEADAVDAELDRLEGVGLIDDSGLAEVLVRTRSERKGLGRAALVTELRKRHIDADIIERALSTLDESSELGRATEIAARRATQLTRLDHDVAVRRLSAFLQRKGYASEVIRSAVLAALPRQSSSVRFR